jgi:hypothetical protein
MDERPSANQVAIRHKPGCRANLKGVSGCNHIPMRDRSDILARRLLGTRRMT